MPRARHKQKRHRTTGSSRAAFIALLLTVMLAPPAGWSAKKLIDEPAPDFALKNAEGENLRLSEYRGEVVMLSFWASWCGRCREQLSRLTDLYTQHREDGLQVLSVSIDHDVDRARETMADLRLAFPVLLDKGKKVARIYDPGKMPLLMIIDHGGTVRYLHEGYRSGDEESYQSELMVLLNE